MFLHPLSDPARVGFGLDCFGPRFIVIVIVVTLDFPDPAMSEANREKGSDEDENCCGGFGGGASA